jgi:hypothetical protein
MLKYSRKLKICECTCAGCSAGADKANGRNQEVFADHCNPLCMTLLAVKSMRTMLNHEQTYNLCNY